MDNRPAIRHTAHTMPPRPRSLSVRATRPWRLLPLLLAGVAGCDRVTEAVNRAKGVQPGAEADAGAAAADPGALQWRADSTLIASRPGVLFRAVSTPRGTMAVPLTRLGREFGVLSLGARGWRAFDVAYLYAGRPLTPLRGGAPLPPVRTRRGTWEGDPLDTIPGCRLLLPGGEVAVPEGAALLVGGEAPRYLPTPALPAGLMDDALQTLTTLVAPSAGVSMAALRRYRRTLHVVPHGTGGGVSLLALYRDPQPLADSADLITQPPRFLAALIEPGLYGVRASWQYSTVAAPGTPPPLEFLGYLDADGDGGTELFLGVADPRVPLHLLVLRREDDRWVETLRSSRARCAG